jgi:hypothetical protein
MVVTSNLHDKENNIEAAAAAAAPPEPEQKLVHRRMARMELHQPAVVESLRGNMYAITFNC